MDKQWGTKIYCITAHSDEIKKVVRKKERQGLVCHGEPMPFGGKGGWVVQPMVEKSAESFLFCLFS